MGTATNSPRHDPRNRALSTVARCYLLQVRLAKTTARRLGLPDSGPPRRSGPAREVSGQTASTLSHHVASSSGANPAV